MNTSRYKKYAMILRADQLSQEYIVLISEAQIYPCKKEKGVSTH